MKRLQIRTVILCEEMGKESINMDYAECAGYLKNIYNLVNRDWFEGALPDVTVTVMERSGTYGHFSLNECWLGQGKQYHELNIAAGGLNRNIENVTATIIHESVHLYCFINGIKDVSSRGMYHNLRFKEEAEKRALIITKHPIYGYTLTEPSEQLLQWCKEQRLHNIDLVRIDTPYATGKGTGGDGNNGDGNNGFDKGKQKRKSSTRKYQCPNCHLSIRATRTVRIQCMDCEKQMEELSN